MVQLIIDPLEDWNSIYQMIKRIPMTKTILMIILTCTSIEAMQKPNSYKNKMRRMLITQYENARSQNPCLPSLPSQNVIDVSRVTQGTYYATTTIELPTLMFEKFVFIGLKGRTLRRNRGIQTEPLQIATSENIVSWPIDTVVLTTAALGSGTIIGLVAKALATAYENEQN